VIVLAMAALLAAPPEAAEVLRSLEEAGRALRTLQASFLETKVLVLLDEKTESRGSVVLEVPGRLRWNYEAPAPGTMIVKDGRYVRYFPASKQVFRGAAKGEADLLVGFGPGAAGLGRRYEVTLAGGDTIGGRATHVLDLKPREGQGGLFAGIRLWVDAERSIPVQTRLTEPTGDHTTIRFERARLNEKLPAGVFDVRLPGDVIEVK
jgi:outer membrane lipoprotein carrier protein